MTIRMMRKSEIIETTGISNTCLHGLLQEGLFPPLIKIGGARATGCFDYEVNAVMYARSLGYTGDQIRDLVTKLVEQRKDTLEALLEGIWT